MDRNADWPGVAKQRYREDVYCVCVGNGAPQQTKDIKICKLKRNTAFVQWVG